MMKGELERVMFEASNLVKVSDVSVNREQPGSGSRVKRKMNGYPEKECGGKYALHS
jgi:hypothetical protein